MWKWLKRWTTRGPHRFIRHWTVADILNQPLIHPTVMIVSDTHVAPGVAIGRYSYVRSGVKLHSGRIGSFCSIAPGVIVGGDEHPLAAVSTHPFWYEPGGLTLPDRDRRHAMKPAWKPEQPVPVIGHDVWIGAGAQVLCGAVIEDGAVIGAGAVVMGHIPAYSIAAGVPAAVVRFRFDPDTCRRLHATRWWNWDEAFIRSLKPYFGDPAKFLEYAEAAAQTAGGKHTRTGTEVSEA